MSLGHSNVQEMSKTEKAVYKKEELRKIKDEFDDIYFGLVVVPTIRDDEPTPTLLPSIKVIKWCAETETNIDYDLYVSTSEENIER